MHTIINNVPQLNRSLLLAQDGTKIKNAKIQSRRFKGMLIKIFPTGILPIAFTKEHKILTVDRKYVHCLNPRTKKDTTKADFTTPYWKKAKDFKKGDFVVIPCIKPRTRTLRKLSVRYLIRRSLLGNGTIPLNNFTVELFGLYVASGHGIKNVYIEFGNLKKNKKLAARTCQLVQSLNFSPSYHNIKKSGFQIRFGGSWLARAFRRWFGGRSFKKKIPEYILFHKDRAILQRFLRSYYKKNGSSGKTMKADMSTASPMLALQIQQALTRWRLFININLNQIKPTFYKGRGWIIAKHPEYSIHSLEPKVIRILRGKRVKKVRPTRFFWAVNNFLYVRVRKVETISYDGYLYRFVSNRNSYTVSNFLVHS